MTSLLEARNVGIEGRFGPADLEIGESSLVGLIGPNGGGKTSLLRALAGVEDAQGTVYVEGEELPASPPARRARLLSFLPASRDFIWPIAARDVIALGVVEPDRERIDALVDQLELAPLVDRPLSQLSTGERSRVLMARAFAANPRLLLLDEPLANLDPYWAIRTLELAREAVTGSRCAAILSLHDLSQAEAFDRLLLVDRGQIAADGPPTAVLDGDAFAEGFRVARSGAGWKIRPSADRRSSP